MADKEEIALLLWFWYRYCKPCGAFIRLDKTIDHERQGHDILHLDYPYLRDKIDLSGDKILPVSEVP